MALSRKCAIQLASVYLCALQTKTWRLDARLETPNNAVTDLVGTRRVRVMSRCRAAFMHVLSDVHLRRCLRIHDFP